MKLFNDGVGLMCWIVQDDNGESLAFFRSLRYWRNNVVKYGVVWHGGAWSGQAG